MNKFRVITNMIVAGAVYLGAASAALAQTIPVVVSFTILGDVVKNVGGDHVSVKSLVPPDGDPHSYSPTPQDSKALKSAAVSFVSGEDLETWFKRLARASGGIDPVVVSDGIKTHSLYEHGQTMIDPHVWNSVPNIVVWVANIEEALIKADPANAADFRANAKRYNAQLKKTDGWIRHELKSIPRDRRKVLTDHDVFGYYGREYGVTFLAPVGLSTANEPPAKKVARVIDQMKKEKIHTYFIANSSSSQLVKQIAYATGAKSGGVLYPESLSEANGPASTYIDMMRYNTRLIVNAIK
ncbi:metal ABC transporter solute-binding protein, Zn/Mn family [Psychrobacter sp. LV10R520-6]|uniref:metal ABC transporter solute-binding protein, Zn/Mn family n=1 Tax=Psychrobacter sp. LV10R520-6 TaxID=1415574 RepID=UPI0024C7CB5C|nr:zinc ABC transporter substrate-binding protein [Psychrobacter sp. LV10R520-6]SNT69854.1 zinc/manganese transport system substrate-binding protein [Psychrobacter sp. LV10R520-6]